MAFIHCPEKQFVYLYDHHTIGRLHKKVDTLIEDKFVSRIHAVIQWQEPHWKIRDLSSNGTWINGERIPRNQLSDLSLNDKIQFGSPDAFSYVLNDYSPPTDALTGVYSGGKQKPKVVPLNMYHFFPNEEEPEVVLYKKNEVWYSEKLNNTITAAHPVLDNEKISFSNAEWIIHLIKNTNATTPVENYLDVAQEVAVRFEVSLDEEHCNIAISQGGRNINLSNHSHHLTTLMLARYRAADNKNQLPEAEQGWVYVDQLSKDVGLEERHLNIQIHRARKQIAEKLATTSSGTGLVERRRGQVRFGYASFHIVKAGQVEFSSID